MSGIAYVIRNGLLWKDAPSGYRPHKTLYNRFIRWSLMVSSTAFSPSSPAKSRDPERIVIDVTHLKAHRTAGEPAWKRLFPVVSREPGVD